MADLEIISVIVFFALISLWLVLNRKKIEFRYGVVIKRWQKGKELIDKLIARRKFVTWVGNIGVVVGLAASLFGLLVLVFFNLRLEQGFAPVLPSVGGFTYPGPIISIPFWYWVIGIFVIIFFHESMHAIFIRLEKLKLKSYGVMLFLILPIGAFVDPDEKQLRQLSGLRKLRIIAAGSFMNIVLAGIFFLIWVVLFNTFLSQFQLGLFYEQSGLFISRTEPNFPAYNASLNGTITAINGIPIKDRQDLSSILAETAPGSLLTVTTDVGEHQMKTVAKEGYQGSYLGVNVIQTFSVKENLKPAAPLISWFNGLVGWLIILNLGVGIANMLPIKPLDGGIFYETIFDKIFPGRGAIAIKITSIVVLALFLFNIIVPSLIRLLV